MMKNQDTIKKQFSLNKEVAQLIDKVSKSTGATNSEIANSAIEIYLNLFYSPSGDERILGTEIRKVCQSGGGPWENSSIEKFSKDEADKTRIISVRLPLSEKEVIERACSLFTRIYREELISLIELKAKELKRSPFAAICYMIKEKSNGLD